jgi:hypothetical protein
MNEARNSNPEDENSRERNTCLGAFVVALEIGGVTGAAAGVLSNDLILGLSSGAFITITTFITELKGRKPS